MTMKPRGLASYRKPWPNAEEDATLTRLYGVECKSVAFIAKTMRRSDKLIRPRVDALKLTRPELEFTRLARVRAVAARQALMDACAARPDVIVNKDEDHWRLCLSLGGFPRAIRLDDRTVHVYPDRRAA